MPKNPYNIRGDFGETQSTHFEDAQIEGLDRPVRFSLKHCDSEKYLITDLESNELERLCQRLGYFESITWRDFRQISHRNGASVESKKSEAHKMLHGLFPEFSTFGHIRVNGTDHSFRVFGAIEGDLFYIHWFDRTGEVHYDAHR